MEDFISIAGVEINPITIKILDGVVFNPHLVYANLGTQENKNECLVQEQGLNSSNHAKMGVRRSKGGKFLTLKSITV